MTWFDIYVCVCVSTCQTQTSCQTFLIHVKIVGTTSEYMSNKVWEKMPDKMLLKLQTRCRNVRQIMCQIQYHAMPEISCQTFRCHMKCKHQRICFLQMHSYILSPTTQPPPSSDTGEDSVGESHLIWMQASLNQMNSCKCGTKLRGWFFAANLEAHSIKKAKIWSGNWKEREMCRDATWQKPKLSKCVDLRALIDSWWDWNSCMAARLNLWTSIF